MSRKLDEVSIQNVYDEVRDDDISTTWFILRYADNGMIKVDSTGTDLEDAFARITCNDEDRAYAYVRFETGDEMSKRAKFAFITWIGERVKPLARAKVSTDKAFVKDIVSEFAVEILTSDHEEVTFDAIKSQIDKAGGANYGIGKQVNSV
ncbi:coactosin-like protein [Lineus longissimus]|uniref:coactosin-like protein n=1 Tax=Lineus longissimus TaxID=88925 RepID=UPI002B4C6038